MEKRTVYQEQRNMLKYTEAPEETTSLREIHIIERLKRTLASLTLRMPEHRSSSFPRAHCPFQLDLWHPRLPHKGE